MFLASDFTVIGRRGHDGNGKSGTNQTTIRFPQDAGTFVPPGTSLMVASSESSAKFPMEPLTVT